jgi:hypothetical protein
MVRRQRSWMRDDQVPTWHAIAQLIALVDDDMWPDVRDRKGYDSAYAAAARIVSWLDDRDNPAPVEMENSSVK